MLIPSLLVAIPVVVDLLLRLIGIAKNGVAILVAIPVVVDLLLRLYSKAFEHRVKNSRNPCCSGPTPSTGYLCLFDRGISESQSLL